MAFTGMLEGETRGEWSWRRGIDGVEEMVEMNLEGLKRAARDRESRR